MENKLMIELEMDDLFELKVLLGVTIKNYEERCSTSDNIIIYKNLLEKLQKQSIIKTSEYSF